ncbi:cyclophilin-like fold protein [Lachnobacterium bovis]|uniref:cyclophilin-like fold protein n=2 Tax=Lachnobacterium bovis TaxID=140626 RepID=UPI0003B58245|nr:cyclophilin-like fold protein [Lachnobacterium bovis]
MMSKRIVATLVVFFLLLTGCKANNTGDFQEDDVSQTQSGVETNTNESKEQAKMKKTDESTLADNQIRVTVGSSSFIVNLEDNETAKALRKMITDEDLTISASNYGGFEKVCQLGKTLPRNDKQITTKAGDVMLYSGNQIVFFYGANSWSYTKIGKVEASSIEKLESVLSGSETEVILSIK